VPFGRPCGERPVPARAPPSQQPRQIFLMLGLVRRLLAMKGSCGRARNESFFGDCGLFHFRRCSRRSTTGAHWRFSIARHSRRCGKSARRTHAQCQHARVVFIRVPSRWAAVSNQAGRRATIPSSRDLVGPDLEAGMCFGPNVWVIGTSEASRPARSRCGPILGTLLRGSKVRQCPPI